LLDLKHFFFAFLFKKSIISSEKREKPSRYINCSAETKSKKLFQPNGAALIARAAPHRCVKMKDRYRRE
jgi:hypothetical protein